MRCMLIRREGSLATPVVGSTLTLEVDKEGIITIDGGIKWGAGFDSLIDDLTDWIGRAKESAEAKGLPTGGSSE